MYYYLIISDIVWSKSNFFEFIMIYCMDSVSTDCVYVFLLKFLKWQIQTIRKVLFCVNQCEWKKNWNRRMLFVWHERVIFIHSFIHSLIQRFSFHCLHGSPDRLHPIPGRWVANSLFKSSKVNKEMKIQFPSENLQWKQK